MFLVSFEADGVFDAVGLDKRARQAWKKAWRAARSKGVKDYPVRIVANPTQVGFINNKAGVFARGWFAREAEKFFVVPMDGYHEEGTPRAALLFRK